MYQLPLLFILTGLSGTPEPAGPNLGTQEAGVEQDDEDEWGLEELGELDLAALLEVEVISVSRTPRTIAESPAAIHVISREDIRRSGHLSLPELFRGVPGMHVARINNNQWAVSARGFGGRFSDKLQVMIDGRVVYNSLFSGVFWGDLGLVLDDIERIEIVRGPGGVLWGSNAVNGVINIITRSAFENHDPYYSVVSGNRERGQVELRQGGRVNDSGSAWWRGFAKWTDTLPSQPEPGFDESEFHDTTRSVHTGLRLDWEYDEKNSFMFQGNFGHVRPDDVNNFLDVPTLSAARIKSSPKLNNGSVLARWDHVRSASAGSSLFGSIDFTSSNGLGFDYNSRNATLDYLSYNEPWSGHVLTWGGGYSYAEVDVDGGQPIFETSKAQHNNVFTSFVQDEWEISPTWSMIVGSRFEYRRLGGFSVQPSARVLWKPQQSDKSAWASVSRALRAPSFLDVDLELPAGALPPAGPAPPVLVSLVGDSDFKSEELLAYEIGYRQQLAENLSVDLTGFYFDYEELSSSVPTAPIVGGPLTLSNLLLTNAAEGDAYGVEASVNYSPRRDWRLSASGSWIEIDVPTGVGTGIAESNESNNTPRFLGALHSSHDLSDSLELDIALYGVSAVGNLERHIRGDLRLGWQIDRNWNLSAALQDAFDPVHQEIESSFLQDPAQIERVFYMRLTWTP